MPTAYTDGILTGKVKTFPDFAKKCMRAMMPCIHLKEESLDKGYIPRKPGNYHKKELAKAQRHLKLVSVYSDKMIVAFAKKKLMESKNAYLGYIKKAEQNREKLLAMQSKVAKWTPPTTEHLEFGKYMLEQIKITLEHDGDSTYYQDELHNINQKIKEIKADTSRKEMIQKAESDVAYHTKELEEEIQRCKDSNKWCDELLKSLVKK